MGGCPSHPAIFLKNPPIKSDAPNDAPPPFPPLKKEGPPSEKQPPHWKVKLPSRKWFLEKKPPKLETVINSCISVIKQHWKKIAEIPQECDFFTWSIQNVVRKVKQFARKYYITWWITWLVVFDVVLLMVLFCSFLLCFAPRLSLLGWLKLNLALLLDQLRLA